MAPALASASIPQIFKFVVLFARHINGLGVPGPAGIEPV
ncbi:hypothetical protein SAMN04487779_101473 [Belnapia rosea]|uniref:Uncharacterized protein n=1 Tax=Belnapia rosea TaxID=938405 RepID=A0A1G6YIC2_9PROT|nr:hypothetical protein SAMN04487779_101473 [Belnapia rosea]